MIKKRIFSVILAVLLVVCCVTEAFFIKFLENDNANLKEEVKALQSDTSDLKDQVENLNDTLTKKADEPSIEFYLPDHIYVCESQGTDIYNSSVVYGINLDSYAFHWEAPVGNSRSDRFEIPAGSIPGDYEVTLHIYDLSLNELASKTSTLHVVSDAVQSEEGQISLSDIHPVIYSQNAEEVPDSILANCVDDTGTVTPNVVFMFPSAYEVYSDLEGTMEQIRTQIPAIQEQYGDIPILIIEPSYPGSNVEEEASFDEDGNQIQRWAYAEKTMIYRLVSDLEKTYVDDDNVWIVPNALMTRSENSPRETEDAIRGVLSHLISEQRIKINEQ